MVDPGLLPFLFFPLFLGIAVVSILHTRRRMERLGADLAVGGFVVSGPPGLFNARLIGRFDEREATVSHVKQGKNGPWTTQVTLAMAAPPSFSLRVEREGIVASIAKRLGGQDVEVGDPAFDEAYRIRAGDENRATFTLGPGERAALARMSFRTLDATPARARLDLHGRIYEAGPLIEALRLLQGLAVRAEATG